MPKAAKPDNEQDRLEELRSYNILDTLAEEEYDQIVKLAAFICDVPIALVSLVDDQRQWFKAKVGLDAEETHRDLAFCAHAILDPDKPLIVPDATQDERFADSALVTEAPSIRFYAGCPLTTASGHALGTLCAIDTESKDITPEQNEALRTLAGNVVALLELRKAHIEREQLITHLTESNEELERFAYVASHDLQEPVRMITSFTGLLKKKYQDQLDSKAGEYLGICNDAAARMQLLIDDLLAYARLSHTNDDKLEEVELNEIMTLVKENMADKIEKSEARILYEDLPVIQANPVRILRVMQNLVGNGIKYQPAGRHPEIRVQAKKEENLWHITVKDNGIGMKQDYCDRIFEPFKRLHSKEEYRGTGMGLSICRKIVESGGGTIWAESEPGQGSTFHFTVPVQTER